jgi:phosphoribosyl 1,2-cyclic phosphodiesterase
VKVRLWGVRGSLASAGPETVRYGGNTSSVEIRPADEHLIVLDAGSGIRRLGATVTSDVQRVDVLLSHLHMDHIQGLGFFGPLFQRRAEIHIWGPPSLNASLRERLTRYLSPPLFPVPLRDLASQPHFHDAPAEPVQLGTVTMTAALIIHPGPTVGYRLTAAGRTVAYLADHEPALGSRAFPEPRRWLSGASLADGADLLIHDAQYTAEEYGQRVGWGHSTPEQAIAFAVATGARQLVTFHHDPSHDDAMLDRMLASAVTPRELTVIGGREGLAFDA